MQNALQVLNEEFAKDRLGGLTVPADLKPALGRHHDNLVQLVTSLETAEKDLQIIRILVTNLLNKYGEDLLAIIEDRQ